MVSCSTVGSEPVLQLQQQQQQQHANAAAERANPFVLDNFFTFMSENYMG